MAPIERSTTQSIEIGDIVEEVRQPGMAGDPLQMRFLILGHYDRRILLLQSLAPDAPQDYSLVLYQEREHIAKALEDIRFHERVHRSGQVAPSSPGQVELPQCAWQAHTQSCFRCLEGCLFVAIAWLPGAEQRANVRRLLRPIQLHQCPPAFP